MNFLKENQIRQSMDGKSRWADNIMIERWFRSFKYEEAYLTQYNNIREARKAIGKYVHTYNFERCHSALNKQTPASCYYPILLLDDHAMISRNLEWSCQQNSGIELWKVNIILERKNERKK